ncbi:hypothetical protein AB5N19_13979 [Seiridium cardinale]
MALVADFHSKLQRKVGPRLLFITDFQRASGGGLKYKRRPSGISQSLSFHQAITDHTEYLLVFVIKIQQAPGSTSNRSPTNLWYIIMRFIALFTVFAAVALAIPAPNPQPEALAEADDIIEPKACCL